MSLSHLPDASELPAPFGRYQLEALLGQGGMGRVYRATLEGPGGFRKEVALKVIRPRQGSSPQLYHAAFVREARLSGLLHHPNVIDVYDFGVHEDHPFLAMELISGWPLGKVLTTQGVLPASAVLDLAIQLAEGLQYAHELEVEGRPVALIHRDLKPANLLVTPQGGVKILDFGLARSQQSEEVLTEEGMVRGTPAYMSPEQAAGASDLTFQADLFAFGLILYEAAAGQPAWSRPTLLAQVMALIVVDELTQSPGFWDKVAEAVPGLELILQRCLRKDPAERFARTADLVGALHELSHALGEGPSLRACLEAMPPGLLPVASVDAYMETRPGVAGAFGPSGGGVGSEPASGPQTLASNLRELSDSFRGRERELASLQDLVGTGRRVITLRGTGGSGKTRLAQEFAARQQGSFSGGAYFCDLTEARSVPGILKAVATALDVPLTQRDPSAQLAHVLRSRGPMLLVLDNFEQVAEQAEATLGVWQETAPQAVFLVTSRLALEIPGESVFAVDPLLPDEAVALFFDRAEEVRPGVRALPGCEEAVRQIVEQLDGLALAVELAAARTRVLTPEQVLRRLSERFKLLRSRRQDRSDRQATLRGAIDWSWRLLEPWEQAGLAQASIFRGGFTPESADAVLDLSSFEGAPSPRLVVAELVAHSLLRIVRFEGGKLRYRMLESIRAFAADRLEELGDGGAAERRHLMHYSALGSREALGSLHTHGGTERRSALGRELQNLVGASQSSLAPQEPDAVASCALAGAEVLRLTGPLDAAVELLDRGLAEDLSDEIRARALRARGLLKRASGFAPAAVLDLEEALRLARELGERAFEAQLLLNLGQSREQTSGQEAVLKGYQQALGLARAVGDGRVEGLALLNLGVLSAQTGELGRGKECFEQSLVLARELGDERLEAAALVNLGALHQQLGSLELAREQYEASLVTCRRVGDRLLEGMALGNLGEIHVEGGRLSLGRENYEEAVTLLWECGFRGPAAVFESHLATLHRQCGRLDLARDGFATALAHHRDVGNRVWEGLGLKDLGVLHRQTGAYALAREYLDQGLEVQREVGDSRSEGITLGHIAGLLKDTGDFEGAREHYEQSLSIHRAVDNQWYEGTTLANLGDLHRMLGDFGRAREYFEHALGIHRRAGNRIGESAALGNLGDLLLLDGDPVAAEALLGRAVEIADEPRPFVAGAFRGSLALIAAGRGDHAEARALADRATVQLKGIHNFQYAKLLSKRVRIELLAGDPAAARQALAEAEELVAALELPAESELVQVVSAARELLEE